MSSQMEGAAPLPETSILEIPLSLRIPGIIGFDAVDNNAAFNSLVIFDGTDTPLVVVDSWALKGPDICVPALGNEYLLGLDRSLNPELRQARMHGRRGAGQMKVLAKSSLPYGNHNSIWLHMGNVLSSDVSYQGGLKVSMCKEKWNEAFALSKPFAMQNLPFT
ncbi:Hypothetical protein SMAX5B_012838 [Scophthalmus maximus]|uniref:Uncharacterized protein n=1 Tax=Scophthalmus maximus TaxID=52904 RepID=A0A2U9BZD3_SCOMX|nr:Hypothetical protein SMAX5B_012838 [Scophthalmus maximus]